MLKPLIILLIRNIVNHILRQSLEKSFIGIHLRAERDVYEDDAEFNRALPRIMESIKKNQCLFAYLDNNSSIHDDNIPQIYIASGLFTTNHTHNAYESKSSLYRKEAILKAFHASGLHSIVTRQTLKGYVQRHHANSEDHLLYAEQHAYIDVLLLTESSCFIPASQVASSLSYVVERFRNFKVGDFGGNLLKERTSPHHSFFHSWGF